MKNVGISASILTSAIALFAVSAQAAPLRSVPAAIAPQPRLQQLAQAQDPAVLNFHTEHYSVRIFPRNGDLIMNIFDRRLQTLWLSDLEVVATANPDGYVYTTVSSDVPVTIFQSSVDAAVASLTVDGVTEVATQVIVATVPPLATPLPQPLPDTETVVTCWAFPDIAYIYRQGDRTLMDVSNRDQNQIWLQGVPITPMPSTDGTNYLYSGDITVKVFTSAYDGSCAIMINDNEPEFGIQ